jgi:PIN domain nuclease of toxin-antitoxin system
LGGQPLILLDTHSLIWLDQADPALGRIAKSMADQALQSGRLAVSVMSFWEVAMLLAKGRLGIRAAAAPWRRDLLMNWGLLEYPVTGQIALAAVELSSFHADSIDRLIVATAQDYGARLVTADRQILAWPGRLDRQDARV